MKKVSPRVCLPFLEEQVLLSSTLGKRPWERQAFAMSKNVSGCWEMRIFKISFVMPSGPGAVPFLSLLQADFSSSASTLRTGEDNGVGHRAGCFTGWGGKSSRMIIGSLPGRFSPGISDLIFIFPSRSCTASPKGHALLYHIGLSRPGPLRALLL